MQKTAQVAVSEGALKDPQLRKQLLAVLPRLQRFALWLTHSPPEADHLLAATCQRALERSERPSRGERFEIWAFRLMHASRSNARSGDASCDTCRDRRSHKPPAWREAHSTGTPLLDRVADHAAALPEIQRALLLLVCVEGFTYREAAEVTSLPVSTVMSLVAQARVWLMRRLADEDSDLANVHPMVPKWPG